LKAPELPIELYPYDYRNTNDVLNVLSRQIGNAYREGLFHGYDDIDTSSMAFLIECGLSEDQIHESFQLIFNSSYDERKTQMMYERAKTKLDSGEAIRGTGTFIQKLREMNLKEIENFSRQLQRATGKLSPHEKKDHQVNPVKVLKKGSDLMNLECKVEWIIDKLLPKQSITLLHGKGGIGKTWISLILGNAVSKGISFMDLPTELTPVIFVDFENSLPVLVERVKKIGASEVLFWHNTNEKRPPKLDREDWEQYKSLPIGVLIYDTLRASQGKDENDSRDMAFVMSRLKELRDMGFTIVLLHHTPKSNDRTYKGSTAIMDLADHVLSLHKVKRGSLEDIDDEDEEGYYRLGTKEKTRYEPFHIFLDFDPDKGFVLAPDPDEEDMKGIRSLIVELKKTKGDLPIQGQVTEKVKEELGLSKSKITKLLKKGEGKYWNSAHVPERKNAKVYEPISVFQFSNTIYNRETEKHTETVKQFSNDNLPENMQERLDNSKFASFSNGIQETEKETIDLSKATVLSCSTEY
jgi:archaellum biogenesis ATPase FlaH